LAIHQFSFFFVVFDSLSLSLSSFSNLGNVGKIKFWINSFIFQAKEPKMILTKTKGKNCGKGTNIFFFKKRTLIFF
jgi:hypothetical protein